MQKVELEKIKISIECVGGVKISNYDTFVDDFVACVLDQIIESRHQFWRGSGIEIVGVIRKSIKPAADFDHEIGIPIRVNSTYYDESITMCYWEYEDEEKLQTKV